MVPSATATWTHQFHPEFHERTYPINDCGSPGAFGLFGLLVLVG
jgi:hypothetical protein